MDIKYVDYFITDNKKLVKNIYYNSFNKLERFPFWILKKCAKENNIEFNAILNNSTIIGIEYVVKYDNVAYLMYLAIDKTKRNNGYGSKVLLDLSKKYKTIILSIERAYNNIKDEKLHRKEFYLRNGFYSTNICLYDNGVEYEILTNNENYNITKEVLEKRYTKMTNSKLIKFIISKIFNVNNIHLKNKEQLGDRIF